MKLPRYLTTVTSFSKYLALTLFVTLPFLGFYLGIQYQKMKTYISMRVPSQRIEQQSNTNKVPFLKEFSAISAHQDMTNWNTYSNNNLNISLKYPEDWEIEVYPADITDKEFSNSDNAYCVDDCLLFLLLLSKDKKMGITFEVKKDTQLPTPINRAPYRSVIVNGIPAVQIDVTYPGNIFDVTEIKNNSLIYSFGRDKTDAYDGFNLEQDSIESRIYEDILSSFIILDNNK